MKLSILIPFRDKPELLNQCLRSLAKYPFTLGEWEILLIDNGSRPESLARIQKPVALNIDTLRVEEPFNFQRLNNLGAEKTTGEVILLLNNDTEMMQADFLDRLFVQALEPQVGAVGTLLLYSDKSIQHGGVVVGMKRYAEHLYRGARLNEKFKDIPGPTEDRPITAVTAACLAVERSKFNLVCGMDEEFIVCGGDVDLCLRLNAAGFQTFYLGSIRALHHESKSRKGAKLPPSDFTKSEMSYSTYLQGRPDPYYPDFLSRNHFKPKRLPLPHGKIGHWLQDLRYRFFQLKSAFKHGGQSRIFRILSERRSFGYSTRSLSYSWPKKLLLKLDALAPQKRHYFIPHLKGKQTYGGIATLIKFAVEDARQGNFVHFVLQDAGGEFENIARAASLSNEEWKQIGHRFSATRFDYCEHISLKVSPFDTFVATAWWTKLTLDSAQIPADKITYIIQDFEPLFYDETDAVESQLNRLATLSYNKVKNAKINSKFLADYLFKNRILKEWELVHKDIFDPVIDQHIFFEDPGVSKKKQLFVYARPEVGRNRFDICLAALKAIAADIPDGWEICGLGTLKQDVSLGHGKKLIAKGKLSFFDYVHFLKSSPLGLCLMESPHPSYPPLELAACGGLVVCNRYANKDYALLGKRYLCCDLNTQAVAQTLLQTLLVVDAALRFSPGPLTQDDKELKSPAFQ